MVPPAEPLTATPLPDLFQEILTLIHRRFAGDTLAIMSEQGLTMPQMVALYVMQAAGPVPNTVIVEELRISPSTASHLVDQLVRKGLVNRTEDPHDRRQKRLAITAEGRALLERLGRERTLEFTRAAASLDPETRDALSLVMGRAVDELRRGLTGRSCSPPVAPSETP